MMKRLRHWWWMFRLRRGAAHVWHIEDWLRESRRGRTVFIVHRPMLWEVPGGAKVENCIFIPAKDFPRNAAALLTIRSKAS